MKCPKCEGLGKCPEYTTGALWSCPACNGTVEADTSLVREQNEKFRDELARLKTTALNYLDQWNIWETRGQGLRVEVEELKAEVERLKDREAKWRELAELDEYFHQVNLKIPDEHKLCVDVDKVSRRIELRSELMEEGI